MATRNLFIAAYDVRSPRRLRRALHVLNSTLLLALDREGITLVATNPRHPDNVMVCGSYRHGNAARRLNQYAWLRDDDKCLDAARGIVAAKLLAQYRALGAHRRRRPDLRRPLTRSMGVIRERWRALASAQSLDTLRGLEGAAAAAYFSALTQLVPPSWNFAGRRRRPPPDPVNALLSLTYTLLHGEAVRTLLELKLDGPALCLRAEGKSRQWFPLRRLSMVICIDVPAKGMEALAATASRGIPVSLFSPSGRMIAQLVHPGALPNPLSHWLEAVPYDKPLASAYGDWLDNQLRHTYALIGCLGRDSAQGADRAEAQLRRLARDGKCPGILTGAGEWMDGLVTALLQAEGTRLGLSASSTQVAGIMADLRQAGITLALTWLVVAVRHLGVREVNNIPAFFEKHLADDLGNWAARAFFTLANQLERKAMGQDLPPPVRR